MDGLRFAPHANRQAFLGRAEYLALLGLFAVFVVFAGLVEYRSAFQQTRKGDLNVFLRAGWAIRADADPYAVTDDNGFHYHYPPLLAILAAPLADAPAGADRSGMIPYPVSVALCYVLNLIFLAFAVHRLAGALEETTAGPFRLTWPRGSRGWWALRLSPMLACLVPIGHTLMRGQVNLLLLALFAGFLADLLRGRPFRAGLWLAGAICVKIIPAYLLLLPLWRRDGRCLAGCAAGLAMGLAVIPLIFLGPMRTVECYREMTQTVLLPGLGSGADASRADELTNQTATEGQSILTALHNTLYPNPAKRPPKASPMERSTGYLLGGLLTLTTLWAFGWRWRSDGVDLVLFFGALVLVMLLVSPVCHLHYFSLAVPLVTALLVERWRCHEGLSLSVWLWGLLIVNAAANLLPNLPNMALLRDCGSAMYGGLLLWLAGIVLLRRSQPARVAQNRNADDADATDFRGSDKSLIRENPPHPRHPRSYFRQLTVTGTGTLWQRLFRGVRRLRHQPHWPDFAGPDWAEHIMQATVTDRFHAKQGRTIARWTLGEDGRRLVVYLKRHYRLPWRHGLLALLWPEGDWSPALREWDHLEWARSAGLPVPAAAAGGEFIGPWGQLRSFLAVEELTGMLALHEAIPLAASQLDPSMFRRWKRGLVRQMAALTRELHDRRWFHKDLYLCHFYIDREDTHRLPDWRGRVQLIDLHRLGRHRWTWPWWQIKDLAQLLYSSFLPGVDARDRLWFVRCYFGAARRRRAIRWLGQIIRLQAWNYQRRHDRRLRRRQALAS